jgi:hypothetical protein
MTESWPNKLVVAISSRALFDLEQSHGVFEQEGEAGYHRYQVEHEDDVLEPGVAYPVVTKSSISAVRRLPAVKARTVMSRRLAPIYFYRLMPATCAALSMRVLPRRLSCHRR